MSTQTIASNVSAQTVESSDKPDFGNGRYSALMQECFDDARRIFKLANDKAEKLARQIASDFGAIMASAPVEVRLGKLNKDSKLTLSEASKVKNVTLTNTIYALKALHFANEAGKNGFISGRTTWVTSESLTRYLASL